MMAKEIQIAGTPIPGDDLGPVEAKAWWGEIQSKARTYVGARESLAVKIAEWWDRGGAQHMTWGAGAAASMATVLACNRSRVYQLIAHGRAKWQLYTRVDKAIVADLNEGTLRAAVRRNGTPERLADIVNRAKVAANEDPKAKGNIRPRHMKKAIREFDEPKDAPARKAREKPYAPSILTTPMDDLRQAIEDALAAAARVKCSPTVPELLRRALAACEKETQGVLG